MKKEPIRTGALAQRIQGYKGYDYWRADLDDCGRFEPYFRGNLVVTSTFDLESFAFAPRFNEPIGIKAYYAVNSSEKPALHYIEYPFLLPKFLSLREDNVHLFKPYLTPQDFQDLKELIQSSLISQEEKLVSLAFLFMISSKKHNAFLLSLEKQENFYKRMQVFEQAKEIFEVYLENQIDFLKVLNFAFYPTSSYAFAEYLLNAFEKEILASSYKGVNGYMSLLNVKIRQRDNSDSFQYQEVEFTPTPFRLIDICLVQAFFSARLDLMLLLEQKGANYEIFDTIFSLSAEEFYSYHLNYLAIMRNLFEYEHHNVLEYLLQKGVRNKRFLEKVLVSANRFIRKFRAVEGYGIYTDVKFILQNQDNEEFDEAFRVYAKHLAFIEHSNAKVIRGIQIINQTLKPYIDKENPYYGFVGSEFNALLNPLAKEQYNILPESMEMLYVYCIQNFPQFYSQRIIDEGYEYLRFFNLKNQVIIRWKTKLILKDSISRRARMGKDINYEF